MQEQAPGNTFHLPWYHWASDGQRWPGRTSSSGDRGPLVLARSLMRGRVRSRDRQTAASCSRELSSRLTPRPGPEPHEVLCPRRAKSSELGMAAAGGRGRPWSGLGRRPVKSPTATVYSFARALEMAELCPRAKAPAGGALGKPCDARVLSSSQVHRSRNRRFLWIVCFSLLCFQT